MPVIHVRALPGRDMETKKKAAEAMVKAASQAMSIPETAFTVIYEDIDKEKFPEIVHPVVESLRDKILFERGKLL